uniref:Uncharacterized protein n=1 Tax=Aegilops tauschii TaxID=37682 RepID=M8CY07_AEGTA
MGREILQKCSLINVFLALHILSPINPSRDDEGKEMVMVKVNLVHQGLEGVRFARGDGGQFVVKEEYKHKLVENF